MPHGSINQELLVPLLPAYFMAGVDGSSGQIAKQAVVPQSLGAHIHQNARGVLGLCTI